VCLLFFLLFLLCRVSAVSPFHCTSQSLPDLGSSSDEEPSRPIGMAALDETDSEDDSSEEWSED